MPVRMLCGWFEAMTIPWLSTSSMLVLSSIVIAERMRVKW
jgi:hypothetical protein